MTTPPLNYTGSKHKVSPQLKPLLPASYSRVQVPFCGALGDVVNLFPPRTTIWAFDNNRGLIELLRYLKDSPLELILTNMDNLIGEFGLDRENQTGYLQLRAAYNANAPRVDSPILFALIAHSFSNMIRFNKQGEFNVPFGKRTFNSSMADNLVSYKKALSQLDINLVCGDFRGMGFTEGDFVLVDPPYLTGVAAYNTGWSESDELTLLATLDAIDKVGGHFMLMNALENNGKTNPFLADWMVNYNTTVLGNDYVNSNYQRSKETTVEIVVRNYQ